MLKISCIITKKHLPWFNYRLIIHLNFRLYRYTYGMPVIGKADIIVFHCRRPPCATPTSPKYWTRMTALCGPPTISVEVSRKCFSDWQSPTIPVVVGLECVSVWQSPAIPVVVGHECVSDWQSHTISVVVGQGCVSDWQSPTIPVVVDKNVSVTDNLPPYMLWWDKNVSVTDNLTPYLLWWAKNVSVSDSLLPYLLWLETIIVKAVWPLLHMLKNRYQHYIFANVTQKVIFCYTLPYSWRKWTFLNYFYSKFVYELYISTYPSIITRCFKLPDVGYFNLIQNKH